VLASFMKTNSVLALYWQKHESHQKPMRRSHGFHKSDKFPHLRSIFSYLISTLLFVICIPTYTLNSFFFFWLQLIPLILNHNFTPIILLISLREIHLIFLTLSYKNIISIPSPILNNCFKMKTFPSKLKFKIISEK
jgi:hypothetical protein